MSKHKADNIIKELVKKSQIKRFSVHEKNKHQTFKSNKYVWSDNGYFQNGILRFRSLTKNAFFSGQ